MRIGCAGFRKRRCVVDEAALQSDKPAAIDLTPIDLQDKGVDEMKRRQFVLLMVGTGLGAACSADAADTITVYKSAT